MAIRNSCHGSSGMRSSRATPPIGNSTTSGVDAEGARSEDVAELVRHHAGEQQQHEGERLPGRFRPARDPARHENPAQEQNEGDVHENRRPGDPADIERP